MIIPAIIPKSLDHLEDSITKVSFTNEIQIDLVDGVFVPFKAWPYEPLDDINKVSSLAKKLNLEIDLMVDHQLKTAKQWISIGAKRIIFHLEGLSHPESAFLLKRENVKIGFSITNDTSLEKLYPYIKDLDFIQLMGIAEIGQQGQPFDNRVLERIATLHALYPDLIISVDGGVTQSTIKSLKAAGATRFVSGSAILNSDNPQVAWEKLKELI